MSTHFARSIAVVGACALVAACAKGDNKADSAAAADSAARAAAATTPPPAPSAAPLNDANIFALLDEANSADSAGGNLASTKGTGSDVKAFGKDMMKDHHAMRKDGQDLAKKLNVTPTPPANDTMPAAAQKAADSLNAMPKGAAWDQAYIGHEVAAHQAVLAALQNFQTAAQDTSLKAMITKAIPKVQDHLDKAQKIQTKLGGSAAAGAAAPAAGAAATPAAGTDTSKKKKP